FVVFSADSLSFLLLFSFFFYSYGDHRHLHSFPTRRSSDLSCFFLRNPKTPRTSSSKYDLERVEMKRVYSRVICIGCTASISNREAGVRTSCTSMKALPGATIKLNLRSRAKMYTDL